MKRSVRPLYSILVLIVFFAAFLTCRTTFLRGFVILQIDDHDGSNSGKLVSQPQVPVFNATFVRFAEIDLGQAKTEQDIEQLLEGNFKSQGRYKAFSSWRKRYSTHDEKGRSKSTYSSGRLPSSIRSPEFYRHWLKFRKVLNVWARNRRFQPGIMSDLVALVKNPIDSFSNKTVDSASNKERYKSCAVVGNSGILLKSEYGKLIDSHDFVIRLNIARIGTYQNNVGSKTNLSFVNSNVLHLCARKPGCFCHPYGEDVPMIMYICQPIHLLDYTICNSSHKAPLLITDPRVDILCSRIVKYYSVKHFAEKTMKPIKEWGSAHDGSMFHYSSGVQAVIVALGICDKVSLFGFGKSVEAKHHYHTDQKAELSLHDYEAEYAFYRDLVERPKVIPFVSSKFKFPTVNIYH